MDDVKSPQAVGPEKEEPGIITFTNLNRSVFVTELGKPFQFDEPWQISHSAKRRQ